MGDLKNNHVLISKIDTTKYKNKLILVYLLLFLTYVIFMLLDTNYGVNLVNIFIFACSIGLVLWGIFDIIQRGIKHSNVFLVTFFFALTLNNLNISIFQVEKELKDIYYYFFGPLLFYFIILKNEKKKQKLKLKPIVRVNPNNISLFLWAIYLALFIRLISLTGIRFISDKWDSVYSADYVMPGLSGLLSIMSWVLMMLIPEVKVKFKVLLALTCFFCAIAMAKRGDGMRVLLFCIMYLGMNYGNLLFSKKNFVKMGTILVGSLLLFSVWGNYRQSQRSSAFVSVGDFLGSKIENDIFNWLFGYTGINFDVLKQLYIDEIYTYKVQEIFLPILRLIEGNSGVEAYYQEYFSYGLGGFNAVTFLAHFIRELGPFYFISIILLALIVITFINLGKILNIKGLQVFIMMLMGLNFFGNYFLNISYFYSMVSIILIYLIFDFHNVKSTSLC